jgi:membrane protease YdiL (CAAX protease family)
MQPLYTIVPLFIVFFIVAGLGEELGWMGFLIPRLQARYNALASSIIRAVLVGFWHIPMLLYAEFDQAALAEFPYTGWVSQMGFPLALGAYIMIVIPWTIFSTWMFNNTKGSLLLVAVLHSSEVWVAYWFLSTGLDDGDFGNYWGYIFMLLVAALVIVLYNGSENLSRLHDRIKYQEE